MALVYIDGVHTDIVHKRVRDKEWSPEKALTISFSTHKFIYK